MVRPGESTCLVLNKIDEYETLAWPPNGITVFKTKEVITQPVGVVGQPVGYAPVQPVLVQPVGQPNAPLL